MTQPVYIRHVNEPDARPGRTTEEAWDEVWQHKTLPNSDDPAWVRVNEDGSPYDEPKPVEDMTLDELRAYAAENNIDVGSARTKAQVLNAVQSADSSEEGQ